MQMSASAPTRSAVVTGCAGFIGSHLTEKLLSDGWRVHGIDKFDDYYPPRLKIQHITRSLSHKNFSLEVLDLAEAPPPARCATWSPSWGGRSTPSRASRTSHALPAK